MLSFNFAAGKDHEVPVHAQKTSFLVVEHKPLWETMR